MAERIDAFAHALPKPFYEEMSEAHPTEELHAIGDESRFFDPDHRIDVLDEYGIDKQVITLARPPIWNGIDRDTAIEMTRVANDAVKAFTEEYHDRLIPVATLPLIGPEFVDEFERCIDDLDMAGVQIFSNFEGDPIDTEESLPLYEKAEAEGVPIWLHPQLHDWHDWDDEYMLHKILGWPFDTSLAMARLVFSGIIDEYPDLKVIPHHMGAMVPHFVDRLDLFHEMLVEHRDVYPYPVNELDDTVEESFLTFYADTCRCGSADILGDGIEFFGSDQLVFATDYPFGPDEGRAFLRDEIAGVKSIDTSKDVKEQVFSGNIRTLLQ